VVEAIAHEVERPGVIWDHRYVHRLFFSGRQAFLGPSWQIKPHLAVPPIDALVVSTPPQQAGAVIALPEAPGTVRSRNTGQRVDDLRIARRPIDAAPPLRGR